jgi:CSLREA domain-containing protein
MKPVRTLSSCPALLILGLLAAAPAPATTYSIVTVADDFSGNGNCTLREALSAAVTNTAVDACPPGSASTDTIVLGAGTYLLPLGVLDVSSCGVLTVRGPAASPPTAVISGGTTHRVLDLQGACSLTLEDLEIRDGRDLGTSTPIGAGVRAIESSLTVRRSRFFANVARRGGAIGWAASGVARSLVVEDTVFEQNRAQRPDNADACQGGALWTNAVSGPEVRISDSRFLDNHAEAPLPSDFARGGGADLNAEGSGSKVTLERTRFIGNAAEATGTGGFATAGALNGYFQGTTVRIEDVEVRANTVSAATPMGGTGLAMLFFASTQATIDRLSVLDNSAGAAVDQAQLSSQSLATVIVRDALVARGEAGMLVAASTNGVALLSQLTVTDHTGVGLELDESGTNGLSLVNSIVYGNGTNLGTIGLPTIFPSNLIGIDPLFTDAAGGDYTLAAGSPALDAGDTSFSGIGPYDLGHGARLVGLETDLGAYERGALFNDGFESGNTGVWSW